MKPKNRKVLNNITKNYYMTMIIYNNTNNKIVFTTNKYQELYETLEVIKEEEQNCGDIRCEYLTFYSIESFNNFLQEKLKGGK